MHRNSILAGHLVALLILSWLTYTVVLTQELPFLDGVNLIFHEAGHWVLFWAPEFLTVLGGTLLQLAIPAVCAWAFWRERKTLSMWIMWWWFGQSMVNVSVYVGDARARALPLLGGDGVGHDWAYLLGRLDLLAYDQTFALVLLSLGVACMGYALLEIALHAWEILHHRFRR